MKMLHNLKGKREAIRDKSYIEFMLIY